MLVHIRLFMQDADDIQKAIWNSEKNDMPANRILPVSFTGI